MNGIICCIKKDIKEVLRTGKVILFALLALGIGVMIMAFTVLFTDIPDFLAVELPGFNIEDLEAMMSTLYPKMLRENLGVFSYYIGFFYSLILVLVTHNILPKERKSGRWVLPLQQGYKPGDIITGKCIVYGTLAGVCVFISYMLYYGVASTFMLHNMGLGNAFMLAFLHGLNMFFILCYTMLFAILFGNGVVSAISMIGTILFVPDIMNFLPIGKYLPTYMLTFVYNSESNFGDVIGPLLFNIIILAALYVIVLGRPLKQPLKK